jgi:hypothetical protein
MQFYNYRIIKELDKMNQEVQNFEIYITGVIYQEFNEYLKTGKLKSYEEFDKKIKYDLSVIIEKANNIVEKFVAENEKEIDEQMERYGKQKVTAIEKKVINIKDQLKIYGQQIIYQNYITYTKMCGEFR